LLQANRLPIIRSEWFAPIPQLEQLSLRFNAIARIEPTFVETLPNLRDLDLTNNQCINTYFFEADMVNLAADLQTCFNNFEDSTSVVPESTTLGASTSMLSAVLGVLSFIVIMLCNN